MQSAIPARHPATATHLSSEKKNKLPVTEGMGIMIMRTSDDAFQTFRNSGDDPCETAPYAGDDTRDAGYDDPHLGSERRYLDLL
jgi:hypothetical protein